LMPSRQATQKYVRGAPSAEALIPGC